jgi:hypothetical protein
MLYYDMSTSMSFQNPSMVMLTDNKRQKIKKIKAGGGSSRRMNIPTI